VTEVASFHGKGIGNRWSVFGKWWSVIRIIQASINTRNSKLEVRNLYPACFAEPCEGGQPAF